MTEYLLTKTLLPGSRHLINTKNAVIFNQTMENILSAARFKKSIMWLLLYEMFLIQIFNNEVN